MSTEAYIQPDFVAMGVNVTVVRRREHGASVLTPGSSTAFDSWTEADPAAVGPGPSYRFSDDVAKALLDALLDHYRGGHDARQLRKDYDAERGRVDKMLAKLLSP